MFHHRCNASNHVLWSEWSRSWWFWWHKGGSLLAVGGLILRGPCVITSLLAWLDVFVNLYLCLCSLLLRPCTSKFSWSRNPLWWYFQGRTALSWPWQFFLLLTSIILVMLSIRWLPCFPFNCILLMLSFDISFPSGGWFLSICGFLAPFLSRLTLTLTSCASHAPWTRRLTISNRGMYSAMLWGGCRTKSFWCSCTVCGSLYLTCSLWRSLSILLSWSFLWLGWWLFHLSVSLYKTKLCRIDFRW